MSNKPSSHPDPHQLDYDTPKAFTKAVAAHEKRGTENIITTGDELTLLDLIRNHFPEPYRKKYLDVETLFKAAKAAALIKLPPGYRVEDYLDAMFIQKIALELHEKFPEMTVQEMAYEQMPTHPAMIERFGRIVEDGGGFAQKSYKTIIRHINELKSIPKKPVGRPKGPAKPFPPL